jgi:hypothetical protein
MKNRRTLPHSVIDGKLMKRRKKVERGGQRRNKRRNDKKEQEDRKRREEREEEERGRVYRTESRPQCLPSENYQVTFIGSRIGAVNEDGE